MRIQNIYGSEAVSKHHGLFELVHLGKTRILQQLTVSLCNGNSFFNMLTKFLGFQVWKWLWICLSRYSSNKTLTLSLTQHHLGSILDLFTSVVSMFFSSALTFATFILVVVVARLKS